MSVAMTEEQFTQLLQTIGARAAAEVPVPPGRGDRRTIPLKDFARMTKFAKGEENWKEWNFDFYVILGSVSPELVENLKVLESILEETGMGKVRALDPARADRMNLEKLARELYEVLVLTTEGEAKMMIRNIADQDGILAWHRLYRHYNRRTLARVLRIHREAMHPKSSRSVENLISDIVEWEDRWEKMAKEYPAVPVLWKMAALMELCPNDVQDMVYQTIDDVHEDYEKLKQKIVSWTSNKVTRDGSVPMEIGEVDPEEANVDAISSHSQCYNCGGWGHASRECPSQKGVKGKGKGKDQSQTKGKGKGYQDYSQGYQNYQSTKGKSKGYQEYSSGGQGYQGKCHKCGKVGHKAAECRSPGWNVQAVEEQEENKEEQSGGWTEQNEWKEQTEVNVATVWSVGQIDVLATTSEKEEDKFSITLDSGAGASCWPVGMMQDVEMEPKQPGIKFRAANGEELKYFGRKSIGFRPVGAELGKNECNMKFHVTNTTKPLASAMAVVNAGNRVVLTKEPGGSHIENIVTKRRIKLKEVGGTFVFDVEGGRKVGSSGFKRRA